MVLIRQGDILFLEARQFSRELIARTIILDIDLEVRSLEVRQERLIEDIKQTIKIIFFFCEIMTRCKWNQTKHKANPLSATCRSGTLMRVAVRELLNNSMKSRALAPSDLSISSPGLSPSLQFLLYHY